MTNTQKPAQAVRYTINPELMPLAWQGDSWGFWLYRNRSWLNSVWLGTVVNVLAWPQRVWYDVIRNIVQFSPLRLLLGLVTVWLFPITFFVAGLFGHLTMLHLPLEVILDAEVMDKDEAVAAAQRPGAQAVRGQL